MVTKAPPPPLRGQPSSTKPPRVEDFDELDKKSIDSLVDYMKYVATASGITMGFYAKGVQENVASIQGGLSKLVVFSPVIFWFLAIVFSVIGVFPRTYKADSDFEKEQIVVKIRAVKSGYSRVAISCFLLGFFLFVYVSAAMLWKFYPLG
jgi:hypothetical protein